MILPLADGGSYDLKPSKIVGVGLNYRDHIAENPSILAGAARCGAAPVQELSPEPVLFPKTPNTIIGPGEPIVIPSTLLRARGITAPRTDYEAELAVIIGRPCRRVRKAEALAYVLGYSCFNDVSQRELQNGDRSGWWRGKSLDGFGPIGPCIVPAAALPDPQNLAIECRLNGRVVQRSTTAAMIFGVAELISYISDYFTLEPGDIIATGTPSGVGPLKAGDLVEVEIEGIGTLANPVREE